MAVSEGLQGISTSYVLKQRPQPNGCLCFLKASVKMVSGALVVPPLPAVLGPVVRKSVNANPGIKVKSGFDFYCIKAYIRANVLWVLP